MEDDAVKALTPVRAKAHEGVYTIGSEAERHAIGNKGVKLKEFATEEEAWRFIRDPFLSRHVEYKIQRFEHEAAIVLHCFSLIQKEE